MNIGILGGGTLAKAAASRLADVHALHALGPAPGWVDPEGRVAAVPMAADAARQCEAVLVCAESPAQANQWLTDAQGPCAGLAPGTVVIDLGAGDPLLAQELAAQMAPRGLHFIDAPLHSEMLGALPDTAAITCGGSAETVQRLLPVLQALCSKVIHCGEVGQGRAAHLIVSVVAASNRMVTLECAAMGFCNGLSVQDMAHVLTRCSGYSSGTAKVLPALTEAGATADVLLASVVADLAMASQMAARSGAPLVIGNLVRSLMQSEASLLGPTAGLDDTARVFHAATASVAASV